MFKWMFLPLKRYAEFSGRSCRKEYWWWFLFTQGLALLIMAPYLVSFFKLFLQGWEVAMSGVAPDEGEMRVLFSSTAKSGWLSMGLISLVTLAFFVPNLALHLRRFHDCGFEAQVFWILFGCCFIPFFGVFPAATLWVISGFFPGTRGPNPFGEDPSGGAPRAEATGGAGAISASAGGGGESREWPAG